MDSLFYLFLSSFPSCSFPLWLGQTVKAEMLPVFEWGLIWTVSERWNMVHVIDIQRQTEAAHISISCQVIVVDLYVTLLCNTFWPRGSSSMASSSVFLTLLVSLHMGACQLRSGCHVTIRSLSKSRWIQSAWSYLHQHNVLPHFSRFLFGSKCFSLLSLLVCSISCITSRVLVFPSGFNQHSMLVHCVSQLISLPDVSI